MTDTNTQGASWEEEFDERWGGSLRVYEPHLPSGFRGASAEIKDFIRTLLSKERAEGERLGVVTERMRVLEILHSKFMAATNIHALNVIEEAQKEILATLPADSIEV